MAKTLSKILEVYAPKSKDEKKFMDKHVTVNNKLDDRGTQDDKLFKATNIKSVNRETEHGYNPGSDEKVYEEHSSKRLHPMALHVQDVGKGKHKVHAVGDELSDGISVGEHLSDSELDDATEMGAKIKRVTVIGKNKITEKVAEEAEQLTEDEELTQLLNTIYENLSDENKEIFEQILDEDPDQMIEFLEQLELQDGE